MANKNWIKFENNGIVCYYHRAELDNPYRMEVLAKELQAFCKVFFDNGEESWQGVMDDSDIEEMFSMWHCIRKEVEE